MREGLFTGLGARRAESVLSGPIFSGPVDCAGLVNSLQGYDFSIFFPSEFKTSKLVPAGSKHDCRQTAPIAVRFEQRCALVWRELAAHRRAAPLRFRDIYATVAEFQNFPRPSRD
jgi:hypothetical protein